MFADMSLLRIITVFLRPGTKRTIIVSLVELVFISAVMASSASALQKALVFRIIALDLCNKFVQEQ